MVEPKHRAFLIVLLIVLSLIAVAMGNDKAPSRGRQLTEREKLDRQSQRLRDAQHCRDYPTSWRC